MFRSLTRRRPRSRASVAAWSGKGADVAFFGCLCLTPLALGGRHDAGQWLYVTLVAVAMLATIAQAMIEGQPVRTPRWAVSLSVVAVSIPAIQLIPLPDEWLGFLAPGHAQLLPSWEGASPLGSWSTVSLSPPETAEGLALILAHAILFQVAYHRLCDEGDVRRVLAVVGGAAVIAALVAVAQRIAPSEKLLWLYDYPGRAFDSGVQATFANRNHLAHFLGLGIAALSAFTLGSATTVAAPGRSKKRAAQASRFSPRVIAGVASVLLLVVFLATQSRGAVAALVIAVALGGVLRLASGRLRALEVVALLMSGAVALVGLSFFGYETATSRLDDLVSGEVEELDQSGGRRLIWAANARAFVANPWLGHGAGSHRYVYPAYVDGGSHFEYTHAESGYLQIATENGVAGLMVLGAAMLTCLIIVVKGSRRADSPALAAAWFALATGLAFSFLHSVVDFVWYVPALMAPAVVLAAAAWRLGESSLETTQLEAVTPATPTPPRAAWGTLGFATIGCGFAIAALLPPATGAFAWDRYLRASRTLRSLELKTIDPTPGGDDKFLLATLGETGDRAVAELRQVVLRDPCNARAHARLAGRLLQQFEGLAAAGENPMTIEVIADAVVASGFESDQATRDWLRSAFGDHVELLEQAYGHALAAVRLGPLQGESYLQLASLGFLQNRSFEGLESQAVRLRPFDGRVLFEAGRRLHLAGDVEAAFGLYRQSVRLPGSHRQRLLFALARVLPAESLLERLNPDSSATDLVLAAYRGAGTEGDLAAIAAHATAQAEREAPNLPPAAAAQLWRQVSATQRSLEHVPEAVACGRKAYEIAPNEFGVRHELALALFAAREFSEADPHLRWCLARRPDLIYLQQALQNAGRQRAAETLERHRRSPLPEPTSKVAAGPDAGDTNGTIER